VIISWDVMPVISAKVQIQFGGTYCLLLLGRRKETDKKHPVSCLAYISTLQMRAVRSAGTSLNFYQRARPYILQRYGKKNFNNAGNNSDYMVPNDGMIMKNELYGCGRKMVCFLFTDAVSNADRMIIEYEVADGMRVGRRNTSTREEPDPVSHFLPQIPLESNPGRSGGPPATNHLISPVWRRGRIPPP
jgi:hypothetical protein